MDFFSIFQGLKRNKFYLSLGSFELKIIPINTASNSLKSKQNEIEHINALKYYKTSKEISLVNFSIKNFLPQLCVSKKCKQSKPIKREHFLFNYFVMFLSFNSFINMKVWVPKRVSWEVKGGELQFLRKVSLDKLKNILIEIFYEDCI